MADFLILFGETDWVRRHTYVPEQVVISHVPKRQPQNCLRIAFKPGESLHDGGVALVTDIRGNIAVAWVGDWRNKRDLLQRFGLPEEASAHAIARLWRAHGPGVFKELEGVLACVVWDERTDTLSCFRDKIGLIPVVFAQESSAPGLLISSEVDWLLQWRQESPIPNTNRLRAFLAGSDDTLSNDFIEGIYRVRPREVITWSPSLNIQRELYWNPRTDYLPPSTDFAQLFLDVLGEVTASLPSIPRVTEMSSGLDSTTLAFSELLLARRHTADPSLDVISMTAPGLPLTDESEEIAEIERALPIHAHRFPISEHWPLKNVAIFEGFPGTGPHFHPEEYYATAFLSWARQRLGTNAIISGVGADQAFECPPHLLVSHLWQIGSYRQLVNLAASGKRSYAWDRQLRTLLSDWMGDNLLAATYRRHRRARPVHQEQPWRSPTNWILSGGPTLLPALGPLSQRDTRLESQQAWKWELVCRTGARKARRSGTTRLYPMLDPRLWELTLRIPPERLVENGRSKAVLRRAMQGKLPPSTLTQSKRGTFDAIVEKGLAIREIERIRGLFAGSQLHELGLIDDVRFLEAYSRYCLAALQPSRPSSLGSFPLWFTISAELWLRGLHQQPPFNDRRC